MEVNPFDQILSGLTNPNHEEKVKDMLSTFCNGAIETLVKTSHQVISNPSGKELVFNGIKSRKSQNGHFLSKISSTVAVPSNRSLVLDGDDTFINDTHFVQLDNDSDSISAEQSCKRKQTNEEETQRKSQKVGKERAKAWDHFHKIFLEEEDGQKRKYGRCKYCQKDIRADTNRNDTKDPTMKKSLLEHSFKRLIRYGITKEKPMSEEEIKKKAEDMVSLIENRLHGLFRTYKENFDKNESNSASQEVEGEEVVECDDGNDFFMEFLSVEGSNLVAKETELKRLGQKSRKPIVDDIDDILKDDDIAIEIEDAVSKQKEKGKGMMHDN
ncbi:hypothetical protein SSX86_030475 [Deinandra increscens subsp. villosa]|uniref:BED-type domain-containing protein n=1 Tax=Deinandra increscens subsp. villosa TaxID=3103831 RepID=A0AAP0CAT2_9ASTR